MGKRDFLKNTSMAGLTLAMPFSGNIFGKRNILFGRIIRPVQKSSFRQPHRLGKGRCDSGTPVEFRFKFGKIYW